MANLKFRHSALASITALSLMAIPLQAQAAWDYSTIPLLGSLIALLMGPTTTAKPVAQPAPPPVAYSVNQANTVVWSVPQPSVGYTYVNGQAQRVYNVYTPQSPVQVYSVPANYPVLQQTNPQAAQTIQTQAGVVQPNQTAQWQYQVSPVAYQQTVPNAPQLNGTNMANTPVNTSASTYSITSNNTSKPTPTSLTDTRMVDTNASGGYKWPIPTNASGTEAPVSSVFGPRDRTNFIKGCSDGTAPESQCVIRQHVGVDLSVPHGTRVESMTSGTVVRVDPYCNNPASKLEFNAQAWLVKPAGGCAVSVMNSNNEIVTYQHLSDPGKLKAGDTIAAGDPIGKSGNSGGSSGPHLDVSICSVPPDKMAAARKNNADMSSCSAIGGKNINPLDRMDPKDPRAANGRAKEKINAAYFACKKAAGVNFAAVAKCIIYRAMNFNRPAAPKVAAKPMEPLTGKLNMGRI